MICSAVCLVRFKVESPAQSGRLRTLIQPGPASGVHVSMASGRLRLYLDSLSRVGLRDGVPELLRKEPLAALLPGDLSPPEEANEPGLALTQQRLDELLSWRSSSHTTLRRCHASCCLRTYCWSYVWNLSPVDLQLHCLTYLNSVQVSAQDGVAARRADRIRMNGVSSNSQQM